VHKNLKTWKSIYYSNLNAYLQFHDFEANLYLGKKIPETN